MYVTSYDEDTTSYETGTDSECILSSDYRNPEEPNAKTTNYCLLFSRLLVYIFTLSRIAQSCCENLLTSHLHVWSSLMGVFIVTNLFLLFPLLAIVVYFEKRVFSKEEVSFSLSLADFVTLFVFIIWVAVGYLASMSKEGAISLLVLSNVVAFTFMWGWYYLQRQLHQCTCMQIEPTCISFSKFKINIWNCGVFVLMLVNALVNALTTDEDHTQKYPYLLTFDNVLAIQFLILIWKTVIIPITHTTPPKELASTGTTNFIAFLSMSLLATYYTTEDISLYLRYVICQKSNTSSFWFAFLLVGQLVVNTVLLTSVLVVVGVLLYTKLRIQTNEKTAILEKNCQEEHNEEHQNVIIAWISSYYATIFFRDVAQNLATIVVYIIAYMVVVCTSSNPCLDATKLPTYTFVAANAVGHIFILVWSLNSFSLKHKISSLSDGMYKTWDLVMWFSLYLAGFFFIVAAVPMVFNSYTSNDTTSFWSGVFESVLLFQEMQLVAEVKATLSRDRTSVQKAGKFADIVEANERMKWKTRNIRQY